MVENRNINRKGPTMAKTIRNHWVKADGRPYAEARILSHAVHPEGLDVDRLRFDRQGICKPGAEAGHIISVLKGQGRLFDTQREHPLSLEPGVHLFLPPGRDYLLEIAAAGELLKVSSAPGAPVRGERMLLRNERFLYACAKASRSLRWILTPQYLSRRIFLHSDKTLLSRSNHPVSWFRTTMFDVTGLPENNEGMPVFKMSYNSRTEFNVCYQVKGRARVRMAEHPYARQTWGEWQALDSETTYHLNESADGPDAEYCPDPQNGGKQCLRNKHEIHIVDGHVTLFCLFDPAPTGIERHRPGEYSDYEPLSKVLGTAFHADHSKEIAKYDLMLNRLSMAQAENKLDDLEHSAVWEIYRKGCESQDAIEADLYRTLAAEGKGRHFVIAPWMTRPASIPAISNEALHDKDYAV